MAISLDSGNFGGGRIGTSPFLLTLPVCTSEGEGQAFSLTSTSATSEEEGQALLLTATMSTSEEEGQDLLLTLTVSSSNVRSWHSWDALTTP